MTPGGGQQAGAREPSPDVAALRDLVHLPLRGVRETSVGQWEALDDDPQFLLTLAGDAPCAGLYRLAARMHGDAVRTPCVYVDTGAGWSEATRFELAEEAGGGRWWVVVTLPACGLRLRLDPGDAPGELRFTGVTMAHVDGVPRDAAPPWSLPRPHEYARWIAHHDTLSDRQRLLLGEVVSNSGRRPMVSLVMPVCEGWAGCDELVASLLGQVLPDWELWLVHDGSTAPDIVQALHHVARRCTRVQVLLAPAATSPSRQAAAGLAHATGAFVAVLDGDMQLAPHALLAFADAFARSPQARLAYADEDRIDASGVRQDPYFKPGWDPLLLVTHDHLGPLTFCTTSLMREVVVAGDPGEAAADVRRLRLAGRLAEHEVVHIPHVLYHVSPPGCPAGNAGAAIALAAHLSETAPGARVEDACGVPRIVGPLPEHLPLISIVIPTRDRVDLLRRCIESIVARTSYPNLEIIVVDNQSVEPDALEYLATVRQQPGIHVMPFDAPFNYSAVNNAAVAQAKGEFVVLLNNDIEVIAADWLEELLQHAGQGGVGAVGAMLYYPDDTIQHAGVVVGLGGVAGHMYAHAPRGFAGQRGRARHVQAMSAVTAACLMVKRSKYLEVGGLDEAIAIAFNDVDFCLRLRDAGLVNVWTPFAELYHHESASRGVEDTPEKQARFAAEVDLMLARWSSHLVFDPAYHPNLSLAFNRAFSLADAPRAPLSDWVESLLRDGRTVASRG